MKWLKFNFIRNVVAYLLEFQTMIFYFLHFCALWPFVQILVKLVRFDLIQFGVVLQN